jgi:hypothetical protein
MESLRWSVTELVARASDRWDRAALYLALALVVVFASSAERSLGSLWLAFADRPAPEKRFELQTFRVVFDVTEFRASAWRTKKTGEIGSRAELRANKFSPTPMLSFGAE